MGIVNSKTKQNLVVFMEPSEYAHDDSVKAGKMILNRFCIDEDCAFELSGVNYLKKIRCSWERKDKGKEYLFLRSNFIL